MNIRVLHDLAPQGHLPLHKDTKFSRRILTRLDIELRETQKKFIDAQYQLLLSQFQAKKAEVELLRISGELAKTLSF